MSDRVLLTQSFTTPMPAVQPPKMSIHVREIEKAIALFIGIDRVGAAPKRVGAAPKRVGGGWYVPVKDGGEIYIPALAFAGCGGDHARIRDVLSAFTCAYYEGRRDTRNRHVTETCSECRRHVSDRGWMEDGCRSHAGRREAILSSQGSLNVSESRELWQVRQFLEGSAS